MGAVRVANDLNVPTHFGETHTLFLLMMVPPEIILSKTWVWFCSRGILILHGLCFGMRHGK